MPLDLRDRQAEFFEEYFKKGAEFTTALIAENDELRRRLEAAEAAAGGEPADRALATAHAEIERDHYDLACMFVAQGQLARARDAGEALGVIAEVLLNFVGADRFVIYAADSTRVLRPLFAAEIDLADLPSEAPAHLVRAFEDDRAFSASIDPAKTAELSGEPLVAFPIRCGRAPFGAVAIWSFLGQKTRLEPIDDRLFEVIAEAGGCALETARIRGQVPRLTGTPDHFSGLALLLGIGGRHGR